MRGEVVDVATAALWLAFSPETVRRWCKQGVLAGAYQAGGRCSDWRIPTEALELKRPRPWWFMPDLDI